jgi:hypothetical protein
MVSRFEEMQKCNLLRNRRDVARVWINNGSGVGNHDSTGVQIDHIACRGRLVLPYRED